MAKEDKQYKAYRYRLYPSKEQAILINKTIGCVRFVYNKLLSDRIDYYKENKQILKREVTYYKNKEEYSFLKEVDSLALANAKLNLDTAYSNFFKHLANFPTYKKKNVHNSYTTNLTNNNIVIGNGFIKLPKLGNVKVKQHRLIGENEVLKSCTIRKEANKYFVSVLVEYEDNIKPLEKNDIPKDKVLGLDYSSTHLYIDSEGVVCDYPRYYRLMEKKLAKAQRKLSRKVKKSNNYNKELLKVQKIHSKIKNQRLDYIHKKSNEITNRYYLVCFEDLNLQHMSRCLKLGKSTMDNGFGMLRTFISYKILKKGGYTVKVDKFYPSTKTCNNCGYKLPKIELKTKVWVCPNCNSINNRDENAAKNIKQEGYRIFLTE